jgi:magnesium transporter
MEKQESIGQDSVRRQRNFRGRIFRPFRRRNGVGAPPGALLHTHDAPPSHVRRFVYDATTLNEFDETDPNLLKQIDQGVQWIDVVGLRDAVFLERIAETFGIHPLTLEDIVHTHQRPKAETVEDRLVVILRLTDQKTPPSFEQVSLVLCGRTLITFQEGDEDSFEPVRRRIRNSIGRVRKLEADYLMYCLIDAAIDAYFPMLEEYGRILEHLEDEVTFDTSQPANVRILELKRELSALRKISYAHREAMNRLVQEHSVQVTDLTRMFFRDCVDHATQILEVTESFREVVSDLRDLYFTRLSQRTNDVMRVLTIISTVFMPMTFVAGVYGMNFNTEVSGWNMPETKWHYGYPFVLLLMLTMALAMLLLFWKKGWLKR